MNSDEQSSHICFLDIISKAGLLTLILTLITYLSRVDLSYLQKTRLLTLIFLVITLTKPTSGGYVNEKITKKYGKTQASCLQKMLSGNA